MAVWYCGSTKHTAVAQWAAAHNYLVGDLVRQLAAPTVGNERVFRCHAIDLDGTSGGAEPAWVITKGGGPTDDNEAHWTEVTGNSTYGWTAAHALIQNAFAWMAAGDTVYVSDDHAQSHPSGVLTLASPGTAADPCYVLCVDDSATPPTTLATTATVSMGSNAWMVFGSAHDYWYGITFITHTGVNSYITFGAGWPRSQIFDVCLMTFTRAGAGTALSMSGANNGNDDQCVEFRNVTLKFAHVGHTITPQLRFRWRGGGIDPTGQAPTALFTAGASQPGDVELSGVDLSHLNAGEALVNVAGVAPSRFVFENCKLGAGVALTTGTNPSSGGTVVSLVNCDSGDTNYNYQKSAYRGDIYDDNTVYRTGGASDGTTSISRKMVTSANSKFFSPLEADAIAVWNETTGSAVTATVEIITDGVTLTDAEAWIEVEYLGTAGFPLSLFASDRAADIMATPANQTTSVVGWTTGAIADPHYQKLSVSFTPQEKGPILVRVMLAKASTTMWFCPEVDIT